MRYHALAALVLPLALVGCKSNTMPDASLQNQLDDRKAQWAQGATRQTQTTYDEGVQAIIATGVLDSAKNVGDRAPGFTLPDPLGREVALDSLLGEGPVIVVFYRGAWCPYCNLTLAAWEESLEEVHGLGAELVAISPQLPDYSLTSQEKNDLQFAVLSDVGHRVADRFGIVTQVTPGVLALWEGKIDLAAHNGDTMGRLPLSATYLIDTDRTIHFAHLDAEYRNRAEPSEVIAALRALQIDQGRIEEPTEPKDSRRRRAY
ncbi:MAG: peroxiredoxin-like family protein [Planctomycetota bacterium]